MSARPTSPEADQDEDATEAERSPELPSYIQEVPISATRSDESLVSAFPGARSSDQSLMAPSKSLMANLDDILAGQFVIDENEALDPTIAGMTAGVSDATSSQMTQAASQKANASGGDLAKTGSSATSFKPDQPRQSSYVHEELRQQQATKCSQLVDHKSFVSFFMLLTFYALFAPDLDMLFGSRESKFQFSIVTSGVVILFVLEMICQSIGRRDKYFLKAYFWLDLVALLSLLPDTWFVQNMSASNAFVAGRSSRLTKLIRIASRSSKATRLNRLTRIVRVASLMPRLGALLGHRVQDEATDKLLEKKLRRVFMFLDEDMDGMIPRSAAMRCAAKMRNDKEDRSAGGQKIWQAAQKIQSLGKVLKNAGAGATSREAAVDNSRSDESQSSPTPASASNAGPNLAPGSPSEVDPSVAAPEPCSSMIPMQVSTLSKSISAGSSQGSRSTPGKFGASGARGMFASAVSKLAKVGGQSKANALYEEDDFAAYDEDLVKYEVFKSVMLSDKECADKLRKSCQQQLRRGNNMKNVTSKHSEYIAVKVALGVLVLLFVLGLVEPDMTDLSAEKGLAHITRLVKLKYVNQTGGETIPELVHDQVSIWLNGVGLDPERRKILYLDVDKKVYCDEFAHAGNCETAVANSTWGLRTSFSYIEEVVKKSDYRRVDMFPIRVPDLSDVDSISDEELQRRTDSVVVIHARGVVQYEAVMSIMTTILVTIIILSGIVLLTKDLTFLSRNLLKPLRELADDMESIAQLQLAGVSSEDTTVIEEGTSEVRLIRRTFENMKKAIKSWGKYVPWPVVQLLLRANVEANLEVNEVEVTIFFSDIASFTTIVESLPPERSLLLLSRYFNDMSKVIDDHGGVVLEFIGDAILCIYGAPLINPEHPSAGVKSALRMLASLRRMNDWSAQRSLPEVNIRCGVHTGKVLVGNMGFHSRMKYGIVGEDAHIPSRLEEINKTYGTKMMISHNTWSRINTQNTFITRPADFVHLSETSTGAPSEMIHEVMCRERQPTVRGNPLWQVSALHTEAMELYRRRDFDTALSKFNMVNKLVKDIKGDGDDEASLLMIKRCKAYQEQPPPDSWDGVWNEAKG